MGRQFAAADSVGARSGVVVRSDVRKDAQGFEDIDEFWADDDLADKDDDDDECAWLPARLPTADRTCG